MTDYQEEFDTEEHISPELEREEVCYDCKGTGKVPYYVRVGQEARHREALQKLLEVAFADGELNGKTDQQIADLVLEHLYNQTSGLSPFSVLYSQVIDRLERAGGGELEEKE